jgi:hypothetical protein
MPEVDLPASKTIKLDKPITAVEGGSWSSLELSEPSAGHLEDVESKTGIAWTIALVALNAGIPAKVVRQVPIRALNEAAEYLTGFTEGVRPKETDA